MSLVDVSPAAMTMATTEKLPLGFDPTPLLVGGDSLGSPTSILTDLLTGSPITMATSPAVANSLLVQTVDGSLLAGGHNYRLVVSFTPSAGKVWSMALTIICVF